MGSRSIRGSSEIEKGYPYRYWLVEVNVTIEFVVVTYERWMLAPAQLSPGPDRSESRTVP